MMLDWNDYRETLLGRIGDLAMLSPDTVGGLQVLNGAAVTYSARVLDAYAALENN